MTAVESVDMDDILVEVVAEIETEVVVVSIETAKGVMLEVVVTVDVKTVAGESVLISL